MMKILTSNLLAGLILIGCNSEQKQTSYSDTTAHQSMHDHDEHGPHETDDLRTEEVMAIHDSAMSQMSAIMELKQKIISDLKITDSLLALKTTDVLKKRKERAFALHIQLDKADKEMMNWMHQYKADTLEKLDKEAASAYIADQKNKIKNVRNQMKKSITEAQQFIQKQP